MGSDTPRASAAITPTVASTSEDNSSVSGPTGLFALLSHSTSPETQVSGPSTTAPPPPECGATPDSADEPNKPNSATSGEAGSDLQENDSPFSGTNLSQLGYGLPPSDQTNDKNVNVENGQGGDEGTKNLNKRNFDTDLPAHEWETKANTKNECRSTQEKNSSR